VSRLPLDFQIHNVQHLLIQLLEQSEDKKEALNLCEPLLDRMIAITKEHPKLKLINNGEDATLEEQGNQGDSQEDV
jgi:hypothetical protein